MRYSFCVTVTLVLLAVTLACVNCHGYSNRDRLRPVIDVEPPKRPPNFNSMDELNKYLDDIKQYYTLLGRPRYVFISDYLRELSSGHDANFVATCIPGGCHNDTIRRHKWQQSWHHDNSWVSVKYHLSPASNLYVPGNVRNVAILAIDRRKNFVILVDVNSLDHFTNGGLWGHNWNRVHCISL